MGERRIRERLQIPEVSLELYDQHKGLIIDAAKQSGLKLGSYGFWQVEYYIVRGISAYLGVRRRLAKPAHWELLLQLENVSKALSGVQTHLIDPKSSEDAPQILPAISKFYGIRSSMSPFSQKYDILNDGTVKFHSDSKVSDALRGLAALQNWTDMAIADEKRSAETGLKTKTSPPREWFLQHIAAGWVFAKGQKPKLWKDPATGGARGDFSKYCRSCLIALSAFADHPEEIENLVTSPVALFTALKRVMKDYPRIEAMAKIPQGEPDQD